MPLEDSVAAPVEIRFGDKTFRVGPLRFFERGILQRYINQQALSPVRRTAQQLAGLELSPDERVRLLAEAQEATKWWKPPMLGEARGRPVVCPTCKEVVDFKATVPSGGDDDWQEILMERPEGVRFFLRTALSIHHPDISEADIDHVMRHVNFKGQGLEQLTATAFDTRADDPKSVPGQDDPTTSNGSSATSSSNMTDSPMKSSI